MKSQEIYKFNSATEILVHLFHEKRQRNPLFSIRAWSKKLGFRNPAQVADILAGRRNLTEEFALRISDALDLTEDERVYFETLAFLNNAKTEAERIHFANVIRKLKPEDEAMPIKPDMYAAIKDWYYGVLDEMTCLGDFNANPSYLAKRLGHNVTPQSVSVALADLVRIGSIEKSSKGKYTRPKKVVFQRPESNQVEDASLRSYQKKFIDKAVIALDEQTRGESFFRVTNIPIKEKDLPELIANIEEFVQKTARMETNKGADEVYQLNVQFCRVTQKLDKDSSPND